MTAQPTDPIWARAERPTLDPDWTRDGNAYGLLGMAKRAQKRAGWSDEQMSTWYAEATSGNYDHLVQTILAWHDQPDDPGVVSEREARAARGTEGWDGADG